jgi:hypothetical protein
VSHSQADQIVQVFDDFVATPLTANLARMHGRDLAKRNPMIYTVRGVDSAEAWADQVLADKETSAIEAHIGTWLEEVARLVSGGIKPGSGVDLQVQDSDGVVQLYAMRLRMYHLSWWGIVTEAVLQHRFRGISDPDQAWILGELIAYLDHENAGAGGFQDRGDRWVRVREGARQGTLRSNDPEVRVIAERWEHFLDYLALGLSQDLGRDVVPVRPRKQTASARLDALVQTLVASGELDGGLRVPNAIAPLDLGINMRARQVTASVRVAAPTEGRATARVNWILRQLRDAPADLRLEAAYANTRETTSLLLGEATAFPQRLLHPSDSRREPRFFVIAMNRPMGLKRGKGKDSFVRETRRQVLDFYATVVQDLKAWQPRTPQLREAQTEVPRTAQPDAPPFAAIDERDLGEGVAPRDEPEEAETVDAPSPETYGEVADRGPRDG